ncbi:PREDICTED: 26S proteasome non-ATPase regulatory subunit 5-like [Priapulus caudatus]|uniref:26S proteasome non-ATPase regulatory subunit 5 n=1 Tax=Priapulus caudatus TaxID=37621 RepID=A0ABM1EKF4_PRICU|nr:PREDICTED: 26S proteasome non-ATPase regulatory subunit 5-like [Priapulus caudatus]
MAAPTNFDSIITKLNNYSSCLEESVQSDTLLELKTELSLIPPSSLRIIVPKLNIEAIFDCLNASTSEQIELTCDLLERLLQVLPPILMLQRFDDHLLRALSHPSADVRQMLLVQIAHCLSDGSAVQELTRRIDILTKTVQLLADDDVNVTALSKQALLKLAESQNGRNILFSTNTFPHMQAVMKASDTAKFRVYEVIVRVASFSADGLVQAAQTGALAQLIGEIENGDVLLQLNALDLLSDLALTEYGLSFLEQQGVLKTLAHMLDSIDANLLSTYLLPGLIKFFGNVAHHNPKEICSRHQVFVNVLFTNLESCNLTIQGIAVDTLGVIGSTAEGKLSLDKQGQLIDRALKILGTIIKDSPSNMRLRAIHSVCTLLTLQVSCQTDELLALTEAWFSKLFERPLEVFTRIAQQPFVDLHCGSLAVIAAIALQPWGQKAIYNEAGLLEYILDRHTETRKEGRDAKFEVVKTLVESPTAQDIFGRPDFMRLRGFYADGVYYVKAQHAVAMEGGGP